ncbi:hypothetical protein JOC70_002939 [Clostridium pascui]|nr:hypothetical protein [Clostridium pascui]MBM7871439.1 hypothetical protein [Clostridium pascui]
MSRINPDDFEKILENIKDKISDFVQNITLWFQENYRLEESLR